MSRPVWRKSSFCNGAATCVEVAPLPDGKVAVRDGKDRDGLTIEVPGEVWQAFVEAIAFRTRGDVGPLRLSREGDDVWAMTYEGSSGALLFRDAEVAAFVAGVKDGEFDLETLAARSAGDGSGVDGVWAAPGSPLAIPRESGDFELRH